MVTMKLFNKDLVIENDRFVMIQGAECLKQRLELSLRCDIRSWFLNRSLGIDWFAIHDEKYISDRMVKGEIERELINDPEVISVKYINVDFDREARTLNAKFSVLSHYGMIEGAV
jgi:hypothetical protein